MRYISYLTLLLAFGMGCIVLMRYGFSRSNIWQTELLQYMHIAVCCCCMGWTWRRNAHVSVDILQTNHRLTERIGFCVFLLPMIATLLYVTIPFVLQSWQSLEGSREISGMGGVYLVKTLLLFMLLSLLFTGIIRLTQSERA